MPTYTLGELASAIGARLEGDPDIQVSGVAGLDAAGPRDLSFLANPRYRQSAARSGAAAIVASPDDSLNGNVLRSDNPYLAFARAMDLLLPAEVAPPGVHPSAVVDPRARVSPRAHVGPLAVVGEDAEIGPDAVIGAGSVVDRGVVVGEGARLFPRVTLLRGTRVGRRCVIQSGAVIGSDGFGYATDAQGRHHPVPQRGGVRIGDDVDIGAGVTIDRGTTGDTEIGDGTKIDNLVQVGHNVRIGRSTIVVAQVGIAGSTKIGDFAVIGGQAGIAGHLTIGDRARIAAQSGVMSDLEPGAVVSGTIARPHKQWMRIQALTARLPELLERIRTLEAKLRDR